MAMVHLHSARILPAETPHKDRSLQTKLSGSSLSKGKPASRNLADTSNNNAPEESEEEPIMMAHVDYPFLGLVNLGNGEYDFEIK